MQTFAENAVKHGIMPSESGGLIKISVMKEKDYLKLTIEDNGIGRETRQPGIAIQPAKGLNLQMSSMKYLTRLIRRPIKHLITDLYNSSYQTLRYQSGGMGSRRMNS